MLKLLCVQPWWWSGLTQLERLRSEGSSTTNICLQRVLKTAAVFPSTHQKSLMESEKWLKIFLNFHKGDFTSEQFNKLKLCVRRNPVHVHQWCFDNHKFLTLSRMLRTRAHTSSSAWCFSSSALSGFPLDESTSFNVLSCHSKRSSCFSRYTSCSPDVRLPAERNDTDTT